MPTNLSKKKVMRAKRITCGFYEFPLVGLFSIRIKSLKKNRAKILRPKPYILFGLVGRII